jgi:CRISPR type III-B/RAMP module RAMP protein Cmr6
MPTDNQEPTPLPFLVLEDQKFQFNLISDQEDILNKAYSLLNSGLKYLGIGAKTMIGYGYFE